MANKPRKATAELDASKNPMKFIQDNRNMSIKGLKGVAFADGGDVQSQLSDDDINNFLGPIKQIESSNGINYAHPTMQSGIHAGDTAIGSTGLMPNTIREIANRSKHQGIETPDMDLVSTLTNPDEMKEVIETRPDIEDNFNRLLAAKLLNQFKGNQEQAAYAWNQGHNLTPQQVQARDYLNNPYVQKFIKLKSLMNQK